MDLVGVCPKNVWTEWLNEGDCAGTEESGAEYTWWTRKLPLARNLTPGDRLYVVCDGKLRGYAPITRVIQEEDSMGRPIFGICRKGGAVACTIPESIPVQRSIKPRWWDRDHEIPFPGWKECGCQ